jgi:hypothetical protein
VGPPGGCLKYFCLVTQRPESQDRSPCCLAPSHDEGVGSAVDAPKPQVCERPVSRCLRPDYEGLRQARSSSRVDFLPRLPGSRRHPGTARGAGGCTFA